MVKTTHYVEFHFWGSMTDTIVRKVRTRDIKRLKIPDSAFAFQFFDVKSVEEEGVVMSSGRLDLSPMYYYGGRVMTLEEVRRELPRERVLIANMENHGNGQIIRCRTGNFTPFNDGDILIVP